MTAGYSKGSILAIYFFMWLPELDNLRELRLIGTFIRHLFICILCSAYWVYLNTIYAWSNVAK